MIKKKKTKITNQKNVQRIVEERQPEINNTLIFFGIILAMSSIGLLIFVLSEKIFHFIEDDILVGHNLINFDLKFLNYHLNKKIKNRTVDTLELSREKLGKKVNNHKLNTLAEYFGVALPTHSARDDVMTTYEVYKKLNSIK